MEIDPILSLAITLHTNKGCYAALLGSGISRSSGIPTGWDITLDLIERVAATSCADCSPSPDVWYRKNYGKEPNYSELLSTVAKSPSERRNLLQEYFEPTPEEREEGKKAPTKAHKALAKLVERGFIKVIVTTNFDRLMEQALQAIGVSSQVISTSSAVNGAMPIQHSTCTIIKVHGDYLDTRIKNSTEELETYDVEISNLLDRVFDEYGLIVCGWSGDWDPALRDALKRRKGRRFSTYWIAHGNPSPVASDLINHMAAGVVKAKGANEFFEDLSGRIQSLDDISRKHPLSASVAVATLKRYLAKDEHRIQLADLIKTETENAYAQLVNADFFGKSYPNEKDGYRQKFDYYNSCLEALVSLIANGCYWGREEHINLWVRAIERFARSSEEFLGPIILHPDLRAYPGTLLLYAGGVAAVLGRNYTTLASIFKAKSYEVGGEIQPLLHLLRNTKIASALSVDEPRAFTLRSNYLFKVLGDCFSKLEPDRGELEREFDRFECMLAMETFAQIDWFPIGRFGWRRNQSYDVIKYLRAEQEVEGQEWSPLQAGLFGGSPESFNRLSFGLDYQVRKLGWF